MWNHFQTQGKVVYKHGAGRQRANTNTDGILLRFKHNTTALWMSQLPKMISKFYKGFSFLHKPFGKVPTMLPTVFQWRTTTSTCGDIDQWTVSLCCLSDVVDIVQKGLSLYADLFPSHILAQPKRSWISMQNGEKRLFGDMHTRTGMSVKSTQTFDSSVKKTEVQAFKVHFTWSLAYCRCAWMWLCVIGMRFAVCLAQMPPSWRRFQMVKVENPTHLAITTSFWKVWHSKRGDIMLEAQSNGHLGSW